MSTIIKFDAKELKVLANDKQSCVVETRITQNIALQPWCLGNLKESIKNLLDYKIGKFDKEYNGILLSYKNLRVLQNVGAIRNDNSDVNFQVQADYYIFKPQVGAIMKGVVNKKCNTHLAILVHRVFNVVIPRPTEEPGNKWIGTSMKEGQEVVFKVVVLDLYGALPYIRGELDESCLKLGNDEDDDTVKKNIVEPISVSYINFEKTKPARNQIGDGLQNTLQKQINSTKSKDKLKIINSTKSNSIKDKLKIKQTPTKQSIGKTNNVQSALSMVEKVKNKRQSKISESEVTETVKQPKKTREMFYRK